MKQTVIWLHEQAPPKPHPGEPCNGCGVCCTVEPCPVAMVFLGQRKGRCRALEWDGAAQRYQCGMLLRPEHHLRLPHFLHGAVRRWLRPLIGHWIAAGLGCDASDEVSQVQR